MSSATVAVDAKTVANIKAAANTKAAADAKAKDDAIALDKTVHRMTMKIRGGRTNWLRGKGVCEWCGCHSAKYNLDLTRGSHRLCQMCWDD